MAFEKLNKEFYEQDGLMLARGLLGKILIHETAAGRTSGIIIETEAYMGPGDEASHTWKNRKSSRNEVMFGQGGFAYVYLIYGIYSCFNIVANVQGKPEGVLIRALQPLEGKILMEERRKTTVEKNLCSGPGKLCVALGITRAQNGEDLCGDRLYLLNGPDIPDCDIATTPRKGIDYAGEAVHYPWRFIVKDSPFSPK